MHGSGRVVGVADIHHRGLYFFQLCIEAVNIKVKIVVNIVIEHSGSAHLCCQPEVVIGRPDKQNRVSHGNEELCHIFVNTVRTGKILNVLHRQARVVRQPLQQFHIAGRWIDIEEIGFIDLLSEPLPDFGRRRDGCFIPIQLQNFLFLFGAGCPDRMGCKFVRL